MKRRLSVENRMLIEQLLRLNYKLKDIAYYVDSTPSTISREIKNRRITGKGDFKECEKNKRYPYVCNGCELKTRCRKKKYYYNYIKAQTNYNYLLKNSRMGIDMSIGERIIQLRKDAGLSQGQLASALEVSRQAVSKWENDLAAPDSLRMIRLAEVLDTDIEYLSTGRRNFARRPPVVINTVETVEKVVEKPVVQVVEKVVERIIEKPVVEYVEKPVIKKVFRVKYRQNPAELFLIGAGCFLAGFLLGVLIL